jgi:hypothetical protein
MGDKLIMNKKERERKVILSGYEEGRYTLIEAAERMLVSYRQAKRIWSRYHKDNDIGLIHKRRGQPSARALDAGFKKTVLELYQEKYNGFGATFAVEKLAEDDNYTLSSETLRQWLKAANLWIPRRKRKSYRQYRERRAGFGEMLQIDGSDHRWFGQGTERCCLLDIVDDATGKTFALLDTGETTLVLLKALKRWVELYGVPESVYVDLKSVYVSPSGLKSSNDDEEPKPQESWSVFEQVCKRLNIRIIKAYSAQAKGRVERKHAVFQDRFVKELQLKNIKTIEKANEYLEGRFLNDINNKFSIAPKDNKDRHRDVKQYGDLDQIFCWEYNRTVHNDWTLQFKNKHYQLDKEQPLLINAGQKITVHLHLNGKISLWLKEKSISFKLLEHYVKPPTKPKPAPKYYSSEQRSKNSRKNKVKTPWRNYYIQAVYAKKMAAIRKTNLATNVIR